jgi:hypothetical protein
MVFEGLSGQDWIPPGGQGEGLPEGAAGVHLPRARSLPLSIDRVALDR